MPIFAGAIAGVARAGAATMGFAKRGASAAKHTMITNQDQWLDDYDGRSHPQAPTFTPLARSLGRGAVYGGVAYAGHKAVNRGEKAQRKWLQ